MRVKNWRFRGHQIPTYFDASWREKYNGVFCFSVSLLVKKLYAINFFFKTVVFINTHWIPISYKFTSNRSTLSLGLSVTCCALRHETSPPAAGAWPINEWQSGARPQRAWCVELSVVFFQRSAGYTIYRPSFAVFGSVIDIFFIHCRFYSKMTHFWENIELFFHKIDNSAWANSAHHANSDEPVQRMAQNWAKHLNQLSSPFELSWAGSAHGSELNEKPEPAQLMAQQQV